MQTAFRAISEEMKHSEENDGNRELDREEKTTIVNRIISVISTTFTPVIPALIGGGMIKAVLSILVLAKLVDPSESTYSILTFISDAPFYFMPVLLAYGAAMKFKCNPILAITMACALLHPSWNGMVEAGESITFWDTSSIGKLLIFCSTDHPECLDYVLCRAICREIFSVSD